MSDSERVETPEVSFSLSGEHLTLRDEADGGELVVELDGETSLTRATTSWFDVPMDAAVSVETASLVFHNATMASVRDVDGEHQGLVTDREFEVRASGTYVDVEASLKLLVYVEHGTVSGRLLGDGDDFRALRVEFDEPKRVTLGARSFHNAPVGTVTVDQTPAGLLEGLPYLGSSIKEWSAERSWPTLRGHPPALELGDHLDVPAGIEKPDTEVTIGVPPTYEALYRVAPLVYYFGADVVAADRTTLRLPGHEEPLGAGRELEASVDELLSRAVVLDSLVRIGGYYSNPRSEYAALAPELPFYPPELYDEPIHRQLLEYLEVPFETLRPYVPAWLTTATLRPTAADAESLPYLLDTLSRIRVTPDGTPRHRRPPESPFAGPPLTPASRLSPGDARLSAAARQRVTDWVRTRSDAASALFVGWAGSAGGFPTLDPESYEVGESAPTATYRESVTRAELRRALGDGFLSVHYGGEVTAEGFVCEDGLLGFDDLPAGDVGVLTFAWDESEVGPVSGIHDTAVVACLTASPLELATAEAFATHVAYGSSVVTSARLAGFADRSRFVGDPAVRLAERLPGNPPSVLRATRTEDGDYRGTWHIPPSDRDRLGSVVTAHTETTHDDAQLAGTVFELVEPLSEADLEAYASGGAVVLVDSTPQSGHLPDEQGSTFGPSQPTER